MRRTSVKKSSMFKVQQEKNIYKKYLGQIQTCATVQSYPHLLETVRETSQTIYNYCYDFSEENAFNRGINYGCKNFGLSFPTSNSVVIKEWIPNVREVYLLGDFNQFNQVSHPMSLVQDEKDLYSLQLDISKQRINDESRIVLRIVDSEGKSHRMPPLSCKIRSSEYGYICQDIELPATKQPKKHEAILAYTIDLTKVPLTQTLAFITANEQILSNFNTIILRSLFDTSAVIDKGTLDLQQMKAFREIVNKVKNQMGLKIIIQWSLDSGTLKYNHQNPVENCLLKKQAGEENLWQYDLSQEDVRALYLANLSFYLSVFQVDGYHFKRVDSFCKDTNGQIIVKCLNIMNNRLHESGFTLASCKKQVPGLNHPILEGGLGFTFTYNYNQNFLQCKTQEQLKEKFNKILQSSNCVALNLDDLTPEHELNFLFAVLVSKKGIFCKGTLNETNKNFLAKVLTLRKQPQLFSEATRISRISDSTLLAQRGHTSILFNFSQSKIEQKIENMKQMELINCFGRREPKINEDKIELESKSCCIFEG